MWMLRLKGGIEITEKEMGCWDNVPADVEIASLGIAIQRNGQPPYVISVKGYEEICCGKVGSSGMGGPSKMVGFVIFGVANNHVTEFTIKADGVMLKSYPRDKLTLQPSALRRMTAG